MIEAERKAFEHAAKLAKQYRHWFKIARAIATTEAVVIVLMYGAILWRCLHG